MLKCYQKVRYEVFDEIVSKNMADISINRDGLRAYNVFLASLPETKEFFDLIDHWIEDGYQNYYAYLIRGMLYIELAWDDRGRGWGYTVTPEGWKGMSEKLALAKSDLEKAYQLNPKDSASPAYMITVCMGNNSSKVVMNEWFEKSIKNDPLNFDAYRKKLNYLYPKWHGSWEECEDFCDYWEENNPPGGILYILQTRLLYEKQQRLGGFEEFYEANPHLKKKYVEIKNRFFKDYPETIYERRTLASFYFSDRQYEKAKLVYDDILKIDPSYIINYHYLCGDRYYDQGERKKAYEHLKKVIQIDPEYSDVNYLMGKTCYRLKKYKEALSYFKKVTDLNESPYTDYYRGRVYYNMDKYKLAEASFKAAIELKPFYEFSHYYLARSQYYLKKYKASLQSFLKARELDKDDGEVDLSDNYNFYLGWVHYRLKDYEKAMVCFADDKINDSYLNYWKGRTLYELGEYQSSIEACLNHIEINAKYSYTYLYLGMSYFRVNEIEKSESSFNKGVKLNKKLNKWIKDFKKEMKQLDSKSLSVSFFLDMT